MKRFVGWFLSISAVWAVAAVFLVPALETALVLGLMLPGEITVILGGVLAAEGGAPLWAVLAAAVAGPMTGDAIGYALGRRYGRTAVRRKIQERWGRARRWLSRGTGFTISLGRFLPFLRSVLPTTAGAMGIRPGRFLAWDLPAAAVWGVSSTLLGYFGARDFGRILDFVHRTGLVLGALVLAAAAVLLWRARRSRHRRSAGARRRATAATT